VRFEPELKIIRLEDAAACSREQAGEPSLDVRPQPTDAGVAARCGVSRDELLGEDCFGESLGADQDAGVLRELAGQLIDDAAHLSGKYPPPDFATRLADAQRRARRPRFLSWRLSMAASLLVAVGAGVIASQGDPARVGPVVPTVSSAAKRSSGTSSGAASASGIAAKSEMHRPEGGPREVGSAVKRPTEMPSSLVASRSVEPMVASNVGEETSSAYVPMVDPQDFMELDPAAREAVVDLVNERELEQGSVSL